MEHLDNDMDDLFRKAGDLYPLKTTGSDWDGVLGKLKDENFGDQNSVPGKESNDGHKKRRWLLLFIPLMLGSVVYFSSTRKQIPSSPAEIKTDPETVILEKNEGTSQPGKDIPVPKNSMKNKSSDQNDLSGDQTGAFSLNPGIVPHPGKKAGSAENESEKIASGDMLLTNIIVSDPFISYEAKAKPISVHTEYGTNKMPSVQGSPFPARVSVAGAMKEPGKISAPVSRTTRGFYIGFLAGPDLSTVDFQSIKQPGFSLGVLVGYRFNKRLSVETGLLWDKKYYYSTGEYFDKSKTNIPSYETIHNLNGYCNMFEIPVALRYDFAAHKNHGFFAKAGLSSYLMKKEEYNINAEIYGAPVSYPYSYENSTKNIFSILQLSAGYEHAIGGKTKIRIEPYLKIPLQGIGIGNMPISSAGFYLGISHSFR